jgi:hypothetical protein
MIERQPRARLATIDGVSHPIPFRRPRELAEVLCDFLAGAEAPDGLPSERPGIGY